MRPFPLARLATVSAVAIGLLGTLVLGGCSVMDKLRPGARATKTSDTASAEAVDVRRYIGPNYCPELRVVDGAQLIRTYERGHQGDQNFVIWQASIGKGARECLYDQQGGLTLKVGISGRAVAGPKGGADTITVPIKIAVVKYQEAVLATQSYKLDITIPPQGSAVFTEVKEITVPSPGSNRDYIVYLGFDVGDWDPLHPAGASIAAVEPPPVVEEPPPEEPPPPQKPKAPAELPTPTGGFVLSQ